jgi:hypothetical protein
MEKVNRVDLKVIFADKHNPLSDGRVEPDIMSARNSTTC